MIAEEFVDAINSIGPGQITKKDSLIISRCESEIVKLINTYDLNNLQVYGTYFTDSEDLAESPVLTYIGTSNDMMLCINNTNGEVEQRDYEIEDLVHAYCAIDEGHFLDALALIFKLSNHKTREQYENIDLAKMEAYAATEAAGGEKYESFYLNLTGYYDLLDDKG